MIVMMITEILSKEKRKKATHPPRVIMNKLIHRDTEIRLHRCTVAPVVETVLHAAHEKVEVVCTCACLEIQIDRNTD